MSRPRPNAARKPGAQANPGRIAAARALLAVEEGAFAEEALADLKPDGQDGRLAWHLVFGALRHQAEVDGSLQRCLQQPVVDLDPPVRVCLRLGAFEKLHGRTPDHAVVQQWVQVVRKLGAGRAHGLVNAVLRRAAPVDQPTLEQRLNHPAWLLDRWVARYGLEATEAWCTQSQEFDRLCLVSRDSAALDALIENPQPVPEVPGARWVEHLVGIEQGIAWVMDPAAAQVADRFAAAVGKGRVLDACAAPGGKTARLWAHGLQVVAADREHRLPRLRENLSRLGADDVEVIAADWLEQAPETGFDGVLIDAPCTGLGTLRRHPEIRWRRTPADLIEAAAKQVELLLRLAPAVRVGGILGFAVCSAEPEEGPEVIANFLRQALDFELLETYASAPPEPGWDGHQLFLCRRAR